REYVSGELRSGDRPTGVQVARHLAGVFAALPPGVKVIYARADSGFYCWEAVEAYEKPSAQFIISARKTSRLVEQLKTASWKRSPHTDADGQCEFRYQPEGWGNAYRFIALRYEKEAEPKEAEEPEQYQLFDTPEYRYRVFVTNMKDAIDLLVWFYNQRAAAENLIKEANNDAGLAAAPSALDGELQPLPIDDVGLQPELLADAVQPRGGGQSRDAETHYPGDRTVAVPVSGGQDLATCGNDGRGNPAGYRRPHGRTVLH